jgi:uncharacterized protein YbdZ (MbtH family)
VRDEEQEDKTTFKVLVNQEEQYAIWLADREAPGGWREVGKNGPKHECLAYIKEVWTDLRPLSLREAMEEMAKNPPPPPGPPPEPRHPLGKNDLVERLEQAQEVEAGRRHASTVPVLHEQVERGYVFMRFVKTGTELGIRVDRSASDLSGVDFAAGKGVAKLVGDLVLNGNKVRYHGDLDIETLRGTGRLEFIDQG